MFITIEKVSKTYETRNGPIRALDTVEALDLTRGTWRTAAPIPTPRHGMGVAAAGGRIYVLGGADQPTFAAVSVVESYAP